MTKTDAAGLERGSIVYVVDCKGMPPRVLVETFDRIGGDVARGGRGLEIVTIGGWVHPSAAVHVTIDEARRDVARTMRERAARLLQWAAEFERAGPSS